jgi:hypothetical protein
MDPLLGSFRDQLDLIVDVKFGFIGQHPATSLEVGTLPELATMWESDNPLLISSLYRVQYSLELLNWSFDFCTPE